MRAMCAVVLASILLAPAAHAAGPKIREQQIQFEKGETGATLKGTIQGDETVDYKLRAAAGQSMVVHFQAKNASAYVNVLPRGPTRPCSWARRLAIASKARCPWGANTRSVCT